MPGAPPRIDRMITPAGPCFGLGLRKVAIALLPILGRRISTGTLSRVAKILDAAGMRRPPPSTAGP